VLQTIDSQKLQTNLAAIQIWFEKWRIKANGTKLFYVTFTTRRETDTQVHVINVQLPQEENVNCLGLHLDRRLIGPKSKLATGNKLLIYVKQ
jgi:hypothetical protein